MSTAVAVTSRVGRKPISIPAGVDVRVVNNQVIAKGVKGQLTFDLHSFVSLEIADNQITVSLKAKDKKTTGLDLKTYRSIAGTTRAIVNNIVQGVLLGFERKLNLVGVGYKAQLKGKSLILNLGYSQPIDFKIPEKNITIEVSQTQTEIIIKGPDKALVGETASKIRAMRPPEPYKGKGVRYSDEVIVLKETKKK